MRGVLSLCLGMLALVAADRALADVDVRVGSGAGCSTASIQTAIDNASPANGITNILISRNAAPYNTNWLNITSKNVRLIGGYADCQQPIRDSQRTQISGAGGSADSVIKVRGSSATVAFYNLDIISGDAIASGGHGGGVEIEDGPHALIYFENVWIANNRATEGGGLWIKNENSSNPDDVFVWLSHNTRIFGNTAQLSPSNTYGDGGGVFCFNARVNMTGGVSELIGSHISGNSADGSGGGIRAENCVMNIATRHISMGTIDDNSAAGNGGGISVSGQRAIINVYTQDAGHPTTVELNEAGGVGGGIDVGSSATVNVYDVIIAGNIARAGGGGVAVFDNDDFPNALLRMTHSLVGAPNVAGSPEGVAVNCSAIHRCNRLADNQAISMGGTRQAGAAGRVYADGQTIGGIRGFADLILSGTEISGNDGDSLVRIYQAGDGGFPGVKLEGALIVGNNVSGTLLHNPDDQLANLNDLAIINSTITGNMIGGTDVIRTIDYYELRNSIVWQPGKRVLNVLNASASLADIDYLLASDLLGIPASTHNLIADPKFEDSAAGNYRLRIDSPAIDYAPLRTDPFDGPYTATVDNRSRVIDLDGVENEFGAQDLGAYERQFNCAEDTIFCSGFQ
jgi:predicted outer membrane repeat protein